MKKVMQGIAEQTALGWFVRALLYGTFIEALLAALYALGNFQQFSDTTQAGLVSGLQAVSTYVAGGAIVAFVATVSFVVFFREVRKLWWLIGIVGIGAVAGLFLVGSTAIVALSSAM